MHSLDLIKGLDTLSILQPGQTLNVSPLQVVTASRLTSIQRRYCGEGRIKTVTYLKELIYLSLESLPLQMDLYDKVKKAMNGIRALKTTYQDDPAIQKELDELLYRIEIELNDFEEWIALTVGKKLKVLDGLRPSATTLLESPHIHQTPVSLGLTPNKTPSKTPEISSPGEPEPSTPPSSPRVRNIEPSLFTSTLITPFTLMRTYGPFPKLPHLPFLPFSKGQVVQMEDVD